MSSLLFLCCLLSKAVSQTVKPPTTINSAGWFYIASDTSSSYYRSQILNCTALYCHIACDVDQACYGSQIHATSPLTTLVIQCVQRWSCDYLTIYADNVDSVQLHCDYEGTSGACHMLSLSASHVATVYAGCSQYDCGTIFIDAPNVTNSLTVLCSSNACTDAYVFVATEVSSRLNLTCLTSTSCNNVNMICKDSGLSSTLTYSSVHSRWLCEEYDCCAFEAGSIVCPPDVSCQIDCETQSCINRDIDATLATSLTLNCSGVGCPHAAIKCPGNSGSSCDILCSTQQSCEYAYVEIMTNHTNDLKLKCMESYSCQHLRLVMAKSDVNNFDIDCVAFRSCYNVNFTLNSVNIVDLNLSCNGSYGCEMTNFAFNSVTISNFEIDCIHEHGCDASTVSAISVLISNLSLNCRGSSSCLSLDFVGSPVINEFNMKCTAVSACSRVSISGEIGIAGIDCTATRACYDAAITFTSTRSDVNIDITCVNPSVSTSTNGACYNANFNMYPYSSYNVKTSNMSVVCGSWDCFSMILSGIDFYVLDIHCNAVSSCSHASINGEASDQLNVYCDHEKSCYSANVYCPYHHTEACNIECAAYTLSCYGMNILVPSNYVYNYLDINCPSEFIYAAKLDPCDDVSISCTDGKSDAKLSWDYNDHEWNCGFYTESSFCCPYLPINAPTAPEIPSTKTPTNYPTKNPVTASTTQQTVTDSTTQQTATTSTTEQTMTASTTQQTVTASTTEQTVTTSTTQQTATASATQQTIATTGHIHTKASATAVPTETPITSTLTTGASSTKDHTKSISTNIPIKNTITAAPTTRTPTTSTDVKSENDEGETMEKLEINYSNNSNGIIVVIVIFSVLFMMLIAVVIYYLKALNNKFHIVQQNPFGVELIERNKSEDIVLDQNVDHNDAIGVMFNQTAAQ